jgi:hypothetical protein
MKDLRQGRECGLRGSVCPSIEILDKWNRVHSADFLAVASYLPNPPR